MLYVLSVGAAFVLGMLTGQGRLNWVRGVAGKARGLVLGAAPALQPDIQPDIMVHKRPNNPDNGPYTDHNEFSTGSAKLPKTGAARETVRPAIDFATAARNVTGFAIGLLSWCARNPIVAIGLVILALWLVMGSPFGFGKSKDALRLERDIARGETETQVDINERDTDIEGLRREVALLRQDLRHNAQRGRDEIIAAAPANEAPIDPGLVAAFRASLDRLCVERADGSRADSCGV